MASPLAKRLTYRIMAVVLVMMAIITGIVYFSVREYMLEEAQERYLGILLRAHEEFRRRMSEVSVAARNNVHDIERDIEHSDMMYYHLERILESNPRVKSSAILFKPDYYPEKRGLFIPMVRRDSTGRINIADSDGDYDYHHAKWYNDCLAGDSGLWVGPYIDLKRFSDVYRRTMLTTYATPLHDRGGTPVGLLCMQPSLESMRDEFTKVMEDVNNMYEKGQSRRSYCFVIDHRGNYIMHPDKKRVMTVNFLEQTKETPDSLDDRVVARIVKGENGEAMMDVDGVHSWIYYRTIEHVNWTMVIVVPEEVIFHKGKMLNTIILLTVLFGLLTIWFICRHMIREITSPVTAQQAALERELKIAHDIQMAMLPKTFPPYPERKDIDLYASETPALDVGGDLYDYFLRDNRLFFCIGDVSGKGMPAALLMAVMRAMFRSEARRTDSSAVLVENLNRNLSEESTAGYFITMFVGILDLQTGHLDYCNAGHEAPLVSGQPLPVKPNLPVGALPDWIFEGQQAQLKDGDMLFLYTDGLSEAKNAEGQQLGRGYVQQLAKAHRGETARQLVEIMEAEAHRHADGAERQRVGEDASGIQSDDITLLAIKWQDQGARSVILQPSMDDIGRLEPFVREVAQQAGINDKEAKRLRLAVEESVANVINYGGATAITLQAKVEDGQLVLTIDDDGQPFDPTEESSTDLSVPPDQRPPGGLGIMFLHQMTDGLEYRRTDGHNILSLRKRINN